MLEQAVPILVKSNRPKLFEFVDQNGLRLKSILVWFGLVWFGLVWFGSVILVD
ncbi:TPA: hypothetical protein ACX6Q2_002235 [Photobacterium damselae]